MPEWTSKQCKYCLTRVGCFSDLPDEDVTCDDCGQYEIDWSNDMDEIESSIPSDAKAEII